jgi:HK97 family phage portal protein
MAVILSPDSEYYSVTGNRQDDLRYGSMPYDSMAYPSWYGLHDATLMGLASSGSVISYAKIFHTQPWVASAVMRLLSWSVRVPLKVYRRTGNDSRERLRASDHPLADAILTPWERGSQAQFIMNLLGPLLVHGNGCLRVESGAGEKIRFRPRDWRYMKPIKPNPGYISGWETDEDGAVETIPGDQVLHVAWWSPSGPVGVSPLQQLGVTLDVEAAAQKYSQNNLKNMARPPSAITISQEWTSLDKTVRDEVIVNLRNQISEIYSGPENAGKPAILPSGLEWKSVGHTAQEAELIEQRKIAREEIAAVYQIPPPLMGILDKATYSNISVMYDRAYTDSLGPYLNLVEQTINSQLVRGLLGEEDLYVEFDFAGVLRGDRLKEVQAIREAIGTGVLTPNEGRVALNYPKSDEDGANQLYLPANNLKPFGEPQIDDTTSNNDPDEE